MHNSFLWPEYYIDYLCERWIPCQASTSILCLHYRPVTVHCGIKDAYTSEITFLALNPWLYTGSLRIFCFLNICILQYVYSLSYVCEIKIRMLRIYLLKFLPINDLNLFNIFKLKRWLYISFLRMMFPSILTNKG